MTERRAFVPDLRRAFAVAAFCVMASLQCSRPSHAGAEPPATTTAGAFPVQVEDDLGRTISVAKEPAHIAALLPSHTETLFALGVGARVVGVDDYSDYPDGVTRLPKLGGMYDARLEAVLGLSPDLVIASEASPATATMERAGLTVWAGSARKLDDVSRVIRTIGSLVGQSKKADELATRLEEDLELEEQSARSLARVRVYYELDATPYAVGPDSFVGQLLAKAGGVNVVPAGIGEFPKVSPELIAAADPEVVLGADLDALSKRPGWDRTAAVRNRRVFTLSAEERALVVRPGPRLAGSVRVLARLLHQEAPR